MWSFPWNATRLPSTEALSWIWAMQGSRTEQMIAPQSQESCRGLKVRYFFVQQQWLHLSFCHVFIPSIAQSLHPCFLHFFSLPFALLQVLNYFQTPRQGIVGHWGPFGLSTLKNSWFETTTAHPDDSMIWLSSAWSSFVLFCFSTRLTFIPPDDWHWSILESFSCRTLIP